MDCMHNYIILKAIVREIGSFESPDKAVWSHKQGIPRLMAWVCVGLGKASDCGWMFDLLRTCDDQTV